MPVRSVVDLGCGDGGWLAVFATLCGAEVLGIAGPWIKVSQLKIDLARFRRGALDRPLGIERRFDLALALEVAEHLPPDRAAGFVAELTSLAPVVLFSAAIPGQGGVNHVNEQWPAYWARLFAAHGYRAIDNLRSEIWNDTSVTWWYKQNILLFANLEALAAHPKLAAAAGDGEPRALVHPEPYQRSLRQSRPRLSRWLKMAPAVLRRSFTRRQ